MSQPTSRRVFLESLVGTAAAAALLPRRAHAAPVSKRDAVLALLDGRANQPYIPAAFFIHFDPAFHFGPPAVQKHLEYFRATGMDVVKIQYERAFPPIPDIARPADWARMPSYPVSFYEPMLAAVDGLVKAAKKDALVLMTLYSPYMCAGQTVGLPALTTHLRDDPAAVDKGLAAITDSLRGFVKACVKLGVDGFYASTQGGEAGRFADASIFARHIKPYDLALMGEAKGCAFNILHVCDYNGPYADFAPFLDYPGHVVNCNPQFTGRALAWREIAALFKRPCMGGLDRHGILTTGQPAAIAAAVQQALTQASRPFMLGADCTLPADIDWARIRAAIDACHAYPV